jgi:hypothetical protein
VVFGFALMVSLAVVIFDGSAVIYQDKQLMENIQAEKKIAQMASAD